MVEDEETKELLDELANQDDQLSDLFRTYCDKYKPFENSQAKSNLKKVRDIAANAWLKTPSTGLTRVKPHQPTWNNLSSKSSSEMIQSDLDNSILKEQERMTALVNLNQRINYLARKKAEL